MIVSKLILVVLIFTCVNADVARQATEIKPLEVGEPVPNPVLQSVEKREIYLKALLAGEPTILVFYRGGWCPYCNRHLSALQEIRTESEALGWKMVALSPDRPEELKKTLKGQDLSYTLLSDSAMHAAEAFGVAFQVDDPTLGKLEGYGIDLEAASGQSHHMLPVPAVFLINSSGTVTYVYTNPDYKERLSADVLLEKLRRPPAGK